MLNYSKWKKLNENLLTSNAMGGTKGKLEEKKASCKCGCKKKCSCNKVHEDHMGDEMHGMHDDEEDDDLDHVYPMDGEEPSGDVNVDVHDDEDHVDSDVEDLDSDEDHLDSDEDHLDSDVDSLSSDEDHLSSDVDSDEDSVDSDVEDLDSDEDNVDADLDSVSSDEDDVDADLEDLDSDEDSLDNDEEDHMDNEKKPLSYKDMLAIGESMNQPLTTECAKVSEKEWWESVNKMLGDEFLTNESVAKKPVKQVKNEGNFAPAIELEAPAVKLYGKPALATKRFEKFLTADDLAGLSVSQMSNLIIELLDYIETKNNKMSPQKLKTVLLNAYNKYTKLKKLPKE